MHEYELGIFSGQDGWYSLDLRPTGSTGSAPFVEFSNWHELADFFRSAALDRDLLAQIEDIGKCLKRGSAYRWRMFLPDSVPKLARALHARTSAVASAA